MAEEYKASDSIESEPTIEEIILSCADVLSEADRQFIQDCEPDDALGFISSLLAQAGKDPEEELHRRGLIE